jgi:tetratricopeptide (TPR) repeat protein
MLACPDETLVARFLEGALPAPDAERIEDHADGCEACRGLLADVLLARSRTRASRLARSAAVSHHLAGPLVAHVPAGLEVGRRYRVIELIGQGGMGRVVRAVDRLTGCEVALKSVLHGMADPGAAPDPASGGRRAARHALAALVQEFRVLATLRHPNVIAVLDYGFDADRTPYFTMEIVEGARPLLPFARGLPPAAQMDLLVQLLRALRYLHRRGVLHRDLKPSNVLCTAEGALKVVDFGLAEGLDGGERAPAAGTLPYMAPELFAGGAASEASDVYAVGVIAYEMLAGRRPFDDGGGGAARLIEAIRGRAPDLDPRPPALRGVVGRTLCKDPSGRPEGAAALLAELSAAAGLPAPADPAHARDSHLVAARFTGREAEIGVLRGALEAACEGRGSAFLVGGESGVGKSRLLDELRAEALALGVLAARGQALPHVDTAHHVWHGVLSRLALHVDISDLEASVISAALPNVSALIDRDVPPLPPLAAEATRFRLLHVLRDVVRRSREPLLVLLEDLQWADDESLALLAQVSQDLDGVPLLVVASYRDDEAAGLPARLPSMRPLRLARFDRPAVARLCASMLGPGGADERLVDRVARETEGNTLFVVEVLRALAEESGGLGEIGRRALPERILAGGIAQVLDRKLARAPEEARPLLRLAAVAGRQLDLEVLGRIVPRAGPLVQACAEAGILEGDEQRWRFGHDKLRERVLEALDAAPLRELHAQVADGIAAVYPDSAAHAASIAYHHREAGRPSEAGRHYAIAGEAALARGALREAEAMLEQARRTHREAPVPPRAELPVWRGLAQARFGQGRLTETEEALRRVCALAGSPLPEGRMGLALALGRAALEQAARRAGLARPLGLELRGEADRARREELLLGLSNQEIYVWLARPEIMVLCTLWGLNLEEAIGEHERTNFRAAMAFLLSYTPLRGLCLYYLDRAAPTFAPRSQADIDALRLQAAIHNNWGSWAEAAESAARAVACARASRDDVSLLHCLIQLGLATANLDAYAEVLAMCREMEDLAVRTENPRYATLARIGQGAAHFFLGELVEAEATFDRALHHLPPEMGPVPEVFALGLSALCAHRQGRHEDAEARAYEVTDRLTRMRWNMMELRHPLGCALDVFLTEGRHRRHEARIRWALARAHRLARAFPSAEPTAWQAEGRYAHLSGRPDRAIACLDRCLRSAERLGGRFEPANARYWLGHVLLRVPGRRAEALGHLHAAIAVFDRLGNRWDASRARADLGSG